MLRRETYTQAEAEAERRQLKELFKECLPWYRRLWRLVTS